jgi:hypothetical protein
VTDPALVAEAARIERLLYSRLEPAERARLEVEYAALRAAMGPDVAEALVGREGGAEPPVEPPPVLEPVTPRPRRVPIVIAAVALLALGIGVAAGSMLTPRVIAHGPDDESRLQSSPSPLAVDTTFPGAAPAMLTVFSRTQVIAADDSSDIPAVNVGSAYSTETFRHLGNLQSASRTIVGNVYAVLRRSDNDVCVVVVTRTEFVADTCMASAVIPSGGVQLSVRIRSVLFEIQWQVDGGLLYNDAPL